MQGSWWAIRSASNRVCYPGVRLLVMKASDRAAVHGIKPPIQDTVDEGVEVESQKAKEEREKKRKEIEDIVDSELKKTTLNVLSNA